MSNSNASELSSISKASGESPLPIGEAQESGSPTPPKPSAAGGGDHVFQESGLLAWLQCASSFVIYFNIWGMVNAYGVYQQFYQTQYLPNESSSSISWIGSVQGFLLVAGSIVAGPLLDQGYLRSLVICGSLLLSFGMMMLSISTKYWHIILSQGVVMGLGNGCLFIPSIAVIPTYFQKRRALALGLAASGSSLGAIIYSIMFRQLEPSIGFGWTNRIFGFMLLATQALPILAMRQRVTPNKRRSLFDVTALSELPFLLYAASLFFGFMGLYIPFFHLQEEAAQQGIITGSLNFYIVAFLNAGSFFGRLIPNMVANSAGPINVLIFCTTLTFVLAFIWVAIHTSAGIIVFAVLYGFFSGAFVSLSPSVSVMMTPSLQLLGTRLGMLSIAMSTGLLIGNPIAAAVEKSGYLGLKLFGAVSVALSVLCLIGTRASLVGWKKWKV